MPLLLSHLKFLPDLSCNKSFAKFANFAKYVIFVKPTIIDMPLLSSCLHFCQTLINFCQICHFYKIVICQDAPFCHPFVFGQTLQLSIFAEICRFRLNLPFSYNRHLSSFRSLSPHLSFCQTFNGFLPNPPFSQFANFVKSILLVCTWRHGGHVGGQEQKHLSPLGTKLYFHVNYSRKIILYWFPTLRPCLVVANQECLFCGLIKILLDHWWIQIRQFRKICHFRKTHNYRHASFVILF